MRKLWFMLLRVFSCNLCDTCGFTKNDVYFTDIPPYGGRVQCNKCVENGF